jgi:hypothetical protein
MNFVNGEWGDQLADSHNILNRRKNYFPQLLNAYEITDDRQVEILVYTAEILAPDPSPLDVEIVVAKLRKYKLPCTDQIPTEFIRAECDTLYSDAYKFINFIWNMEEWSQ